MEIARIKVLLVEDNPHEVTLIREVLTSCGINHELTVANDGQAALSLIAGMKEQADDAGCPDVMLLDLNLPKVSGFEVLPAFRAQPRCAAIPVIVLQVPRTLAEQRNLIKLNVRHHFCKPSDFDEFIKLGELVNLAIAEGHPKHQ